MVKSGGRVGRWNTCQPPETTPHSPSPFSRFTDLHPQYVRPGVVSQFYSGASCVGYKIVGLQSIGEHAVVGVALNPDGFSVWIAPASYHRGNVAPVRRVVIYDDQSVSYFRQDCVHRAFKDMHHRFAAVFPHPFGWRVPFVHDKGVCQRSDFKYGARHVRTLIQRHVASLHLRPVVSSPFFRDSHEFVRPGGYRHCVAEFGLARSGVESRISKFVDDDHYVESVESGCGQEV